MAHLYNVVCIITFQYKTEHYNSVESHLIPFQSPSSTAPSFMVSVWMFVRFLLPLKSGELTAEIRTRAGEAYWISSPPDAALRLW